MTNQATPNAPAPFTCTYTPQLPELLTKLNCTIAITTYQAGKLVFISAKDENTIIQLPRTFDKPMGIATDHEKDKLALACKDEVIVFANSPGLARHYPNPSDGMINIKAEGIQSIYVFDMSGTISSSTLNINNNNYHLDLSNVAGGIYFIKVITNSGVHHQSIVVN